MQAQKVPLSKIIAYSIGVFGWSISINIISVMLLYLYLPPSNAGMVNLVPQIVFFGLFNIIALVTSSGRLFDAVVDPMIAGWSDRSKHSKGRRIPFMAIAILPMTLFAIIMFYPPFQTESKLNLWWLAATQLGYYFFFGVYVIPNNALVAELGHYPGGKMHMSTAQSVGCIVGMVMATTAPAIADFIKYMAPTVAVLKCNQLAIVGLNVLGALCMMVPVLLIDEKKYVEPGLATEPVFASLKAAWANPNFRIFALADATYFMSIAIITSGLLYYVRGILLLPEATATALMALMVIVTLLAYPLVNLLEKRISKKKMKKIHTGNVFNSYPNKDFETFCGIIVTKDDYEEKETCSTCLICVEVALDKKSITCDDKPSIKKHLEELKKLLQYRKDLGNILKDD